MGLDLRILPIYQKGADFSVTSLECDRDYDLFDKVRSIQEEFGREVSRKGFTGYMGSEFCQQDEDAYGDILESVMAKDLKKIDLLNTSKGNKAVFAYLNELDNEHECYLYWH